MIDLNLEMAAHVFACFLGIGRVFLSITINFSKNILYTYSHSFYDLGHREIDFLGFVLGTEIKPNHKHMYFTKFIEILL